jgi:hypothetical protein
MTLSHRSIVPLSMFSWTLLGGAALAGDVLVVSPTGPYTQIQPAIDAASDFDTILVKPFPTESGGYASFQVNGKSLVIVGETNTSNLTRVRGEMRVTGTTPEDLVVLGNLVSIQIVGTGGNGGNALRTIDNDGAVRILKCTLDGTISFLSTTLEQRRCAWIGADLDTQLVSTIVLGAHGFAIPDYGALSGGRGIYSTASALRLFGCDVSGGDGADSQSGDADVALPNGGHGGDALDVPEGLVFAAGCTIQGGDGGHGDIVHCPDFAPGGDGGDGGDGVQVGANAGIEAQVFALTCTVAGGIQGTGAFGCVENGTSGDPGLPVRIQADGAYQQFANGQARYLSGSPLARENQNVSLTALGAPGDRVFVRIEIVEPPSAYPTSSGASHEAFGYSKKPRLVFLGTIPASGELVAAIPAGSLGASVQSSWWRLHSTFVVASGVVAEGNDFVVAIVDSAL